MPHHTVTCSDSSSSPHRTVQNSSASLKKKHIPQHASQHDILLVAKRSVTSLRDFKRETPTRTTMRFQTVNVLAQYESPPAAIIIRSLWTPMLYWNYLSQFLSSLSPPTRHASAVLARFEARSRSSLSGSWYSPSRRTAPQTCTAPAPSKLRIYKRISTATARCIVSLRIVYFCFCS